MLTAELDARLTAIERSQADILGRLDDLLSLKKMKDFYSVEEVAERVERTPYQVREWLRMGRMEGREATLSDAVAPRNGWCAHAGNSIVTSTMDCVPRLNPARN